METRTCPICGAELKPDVLHGLCPKCVLRAATAEEAGLEGAGTGSPTQPIVPDPAALEAVMEERGDRIGRYKLLQRLGQGGMGNVWMAEQTEPVRRMVALKVIKPGMDSAEVLARFEAERQALALMEHPNIARVLDAGATPKGRPYFVMDLVKGIPITRLLRQDGKTLGCAHRPSADRAAPARPLRCVGPV